MRYFLATVAHAPTPTSAHNAVRNKCVFIAAVAVAALLLKLAASSCWLLLLAAAGSFLLLLLLLSPLSILSLLLLLQLLVVGTKRERERFPRRWARPIYIRPLLSSTHTATRWPLLLTVRARFTHTRTVY